MTQLNLLKEKLSLESLCDKDQCQLKGGGGKNKVGSLTVYQSYSTSSLTSSIPPKGGGGGGGGGLPPDLDGFTTAI